jgi:hypothetical protein
MSSLHIEDEGAREIPTAADVDQALLGRAP